MKTSKLIGAALDWAVAKCEGFTAEYEADIGDFWIERTNHNYTWLAPFGYLKDAMHFSTDWSHGGPIIEREKIALIPPNERIDEWEAVHPECMHDEQYGPTPLITAMRCFIASKLGDEVEIPKELS